MVGDRNELSDRHCVRSLTHFVPFKTLATPWWRDTMYPFTSWGNRLKTGIFSFLTIKFLELDRTQVCRISKPPFFHCDQCHTVPVHTGNAQKQGMGWALEPSSAVRATQAPGNGDFPPTQRQGGPWAHRGIPDASNHLLHSAHHRDAFRPGAQRRGPRVPCSPAAASPTHAPAPRLTPGRRQREQHQDRQQGSSAAGDEKALRAPRRRGPHPP
jgi:hypothetical protein